MEIKLQEVSKRFGDVQSLELTTLTIEKGKFTSLLGPSGSGKTTLLRLIAGLEIPDSGAIYFGDTCVYSLKQRTFMPAEKRKLGMVFQDFALWPHLTVLENVAFGLKAQRWKGDIRQKAMEALEKVRLSGKEKRYPHELSGGEQQRVSFARAIAVEPELILLDEPLSALDAILRDQMRFELKELVDSLGFTTLYVTHDQVEAMSMSDRILVMNHGRIVQSGMPEEIYSGPKHPFVAGFVGKSNWFSDQQRMIRPEKLRFLASETSDLLLEGTVSGVGYVGDRFEIFVDVDNEGRWMAYHTSRLSVGERVQLHLSSVDINDFGYILKEELVS